MLQLKQFKASGSRQIIRVNAAGEMAEVSPSMILTAVGAPQTLGVGLGSVSPGNRVQTSAVDLQTSRSLSTSIALGGVSFAAGADNQITGNSSAGFGERNTTEATTAFASGKEAKSSFTQGFVFSAGSFTGAHSAGSAQSMRWVQRRTTTDATTVNLNSPSLLTPPSACAFVYSILVIAFSTGGSAAAWRLEGVLKRPAFTTSLVGSVSKTVVAKDMGASLWDANATTNGSELLVSVTGALSTTIRWAAFIRTAEVK